MKGCSSLIYLNYEAFQVDGSSSCAYSRLNGIKRQANENRPRLPAFFIFLPGRGAGRKIFLGRDRRRFFL